VLPGRVTGFLAADPRLNLPPRLAVTVAPPLAAEPVGRDERRTGTGQQRVAQVRADAVARIVCGLSRPRPYRGGAVFLADGKGWTVSSIRWARDGLRALAEDEIVSARFDELAEVHVPKVDAIAAVLDDAMLPSANPSNWVARMQTVEGAVLTYRVAMRESQRDRGRRGYEMYHAIQPAWSLTPIGVPDSSVCLLSCRKPTEVPLSVLPAETLAERSFTGFVWPWRRDRSVRGDVLRCGSYYGGLGVGTHSYSEVAFDLPPGARRFTCYVGLDRAVGTGGCAQVAICQDAPSGKRLWRSGLLVGSKQPVRVGPVNVEKARRLVLLTDFAHEGRPEGADPGDIRDEVDWLLPLVEVDASALRLTREALWRYVPALDGWSISDDDLAGTKLSVARLRQQPWRIGVDLQDGGFSLRRKVRVSLSSAVVEIAATRAHGDSGHIVEVYLDGERLKGSLDDGRALMTRYARPGDAVRQHWPLAARFGNEITLTIKAERDPQLNDGRSLIWRSLALLPLVENLRPDGKILEPDVLLRELKPASVIWHPQDKGKRPTETSLPEPGPRTICGLRLPNAYSITNGMQMTYRLEPSFRQFVAVVGSESPYHRGPFIVQLDGKEVWRSGEAVDQHRLEQVVVDIPPGAKALRLTVEHNMTNGVWGQAGFMTR
jgi:hypothetical protein